MNKILGISIVIVLILTSCSSKRVNDKVAEQAVALEDSVANLVLELAKSAELSYTEMQIKVEGADYDAAPDSMFVLHEYANKAQTDNQKIKLVGMYLSDAYVKSSVYHYIDSATYDLGTTLLIDVNMPFKMPIFVPGMTTAERKEAHEKAIHETVVKNIEYGTIAQRIKLLTYLSLEFEYLADRLLGISDGNYEGTTFVEDLKTSRKALIELYDIFAPRSTALAEIEPIILKIKATIVAEENNSKEVLDASFRDLHNTCLEKRQALLDEMN